MKKVIQVLFALSVVFALASITFSFGDAVTGSAIKQLDLGIKFSYLSIIFFSIVGLILTIEILRFKKSKQTS